MLEVASLRTTFFGVGDVGFVVEKGDPRTLPGASGRGETTTQRRIAGPETAR